MVIFVLLNNDAVKLFKASLATYLCFFKNVKLHVGDFKQRHVIVIYCSMRHIAYFQKNGNQLGLLPDNA